MKEIPKNTLIKKLIRRGRKHGYVTQDDILELSPNAEENIEELDNLYTQLMSEGIDVFENEPATEAQTELINHPSVSVTPHIGASTDEAQERVGVEIAEKVVNALKG